MTINLTRRQFGRTAAGIAAATTVGAPLSALAAKKLSYANAGNATTNSNTFAKAWLDEVTKRTGGDLTFQMFTGTKGGEKDLLDGVALGTIDIYNGAYTGTREFDILYSPYFFRDGNHAASVVNKLLPAKLDAVLEQRYNAKFMHVGRAGPWALFTKEKLSSFADLKGMKIRAPQIEGQIKGLEHLGAKPTVVPFNELYSALQQGVVDGMVTLTSLGVTMKFYEVVKHIYTNEFGFGLDKQVMNMNSWSSLSKSEQDNLTGTFIEMEPAGYFQDTMDSMPGIWADWNKLNGEGTAVELDAAAAQTAMEPLNRSLADDVFGAGTWDKIVAA